MNLSLTSTGRRAAQSIIWLLFGAFVLLSLHTFVQAASLTHAPPAPAGVHASSPTAGGASAPVGLAPTGDLLAADDAWVLAQPTVAEPAELLPAYRWNAAEALTSREGGKTDLNAHTNTMFSKIIGWVFAGGGWIWSQTLTITEKAMTTGTISDFGAQVNKVSYSLGNGLWGSGVIGVIFLVTAVSLGSLMLRGGRGAGRLVLGVVIPIAALQVVLGALATTTNFDSGGRNTAAWKLTPAGLAERGTEAVNKVSSDLILSLYSANAAPDGDFTDNPCAYIYRSMNQRYRKSLEGEQKYVSGSVVMLSQLWETTYLRSLTTAQYGSYEEGRRAVCQHLEIGRGTSISERAALAGVTQAKSPYYKMSTHENGPFGRRADKHDRFTANLAWMACTYGNGKATARTDGGWTAGVGDAKKHQRACEDWFTGAGDKGFQEQDDNLLEPKDEDELYSEGLVQGTPAFQATAASMGTNTTERMTQAGYALLHSLVVLVLVLPLGLGCLIAGFGLAVFLAILPVTLLLLAMPSKGGAGRSRNTMGSRLLRLTGTFILSKAVFMLILTVFLQLLMMFNSLGGS